MLLSLPSLAALQQISGMQMSHLAGQGQIRATTTICAVRPSCRSGRMMPSAGGFGPITDRALKGRCVVSACRPIGAQPVALGLPARPLVHSFPRPLVPTARLQERRAPHAGYCISYLVSTTLMPALLDMYHSKGSSSGLVWVAEGSRGAQLGRRRSKVEVPATHNSHDTRRVCSPSARRIQEQAVWQPGLPRPIMARGDLHQTAPPKR